MEYLKGNQNGFFAVNKYSFYRACDLGMNAAVAYLVLSTGTDKSNTYTSWSVNAIENYTGISRGRAQDAIKMLISNRLIKVVSEEKAKPRYEFIHADVVKKKAKKGAELPPDTEQTERLDPDKVVWLPNGIVQSVAGECPPLELIRQTQDVMVLRLFVDMYSEQNLVDDVGVKRYVYHHSYQKKELLQYAEYTVYGFSYETGHLTWGEITKPHRDNGENSGANSFFKRVFLLRKLGLVIMTPYLFDSESAEGEPIHQLDEGIAASVQSAAFAMLLAVTGDEKRASTYIENYAYVVPIRSHFINVALIGVAEMRYKPRTKLTATGYGEKQKRAREAKAAYEALKERATPTQRATRGFAKNL